MSIVTCRECGRHVSTEADFCPHCGARAPAGALYRPASPPPAGADASSRPAPDASARPVLLEPPAASSRPSLIEPPPLPPPAPVTAPARHSGSRVPAVVAIVCVVLIAAVALWRKLPERAEAGAPVTQAMVPVAPPEAHGRATEAQIGYIRGVYQRIENGGAAFYQWRVELEEMRREWPAADSVYATVYQDGGTIHKIRMRVFQGQTRTSLLFYYDPGGLVFVHEVRQVPEFGAPQEQRFYFEGRTLIRWRDTNNVIVLPSGSVYATRAEALLRTSDALLARTQGH